jgi:hypothetical protein
MKKDFRGCIDLLVVFLYFVIIIIDVIGAVLRPIPNNEIKRLTVLHRLD